MKLIILVAGMFVFGACSTDEVVVGNKTTIEVNKVFDAGQVIKGEKINAKFVVKNTGKYPLVIAEISPSCSCTVMDKPEEPIAPGESTVIKASVDTEKTGEGTLVKTVSLTCNTEPSTTVVRIEATVVKK